MFERHLPALGLWATIASGSIAAGAVLIGLGRVLLGSFLLYGGLILLGVCIAALSYPAAIRIFKSAVVLTLPALKRLKTTLWKVWANIGQLWSSHSNLICLQNLNGGTAIQLAGWPENEVSMTGPRHRATTVFPDGDAIRNARGRKGWTQEKLAEESDFSITKIREIENEGIATSIAGMEAIASALGVKIEELTSRTKSRGQIDTEVEDFLRLIGITREHYGQFIEVLSSPEGRGWKRKDVSHRVVGDYPCPKEFEMLMKRYKADPPIREYFGLHKCSPLAFADAKNKVEFELYKGTWQHVSTLSKIFQNRFSDPDCRKFRFNYERQWINYSETAPLISSPLYHHVNAETLVLTSDDRLVLGKRHEGMLYGGSWSASIEEQMLRGDPEKPKRKDSHIFDAAERGAREELGVKLIPDETTLLKVGIEWGNFTAAFLFVVRCKETFSEVVECWQRVRHDPNESVALDSIAATADVCKKAADLRLYSPSGDWVKRVVVNRAEGEWHPTAVARLHALRGYLEYTSE